MIVICDRFKLPAVKLCEKFMNSFELAYALMFCTSLNVPLVVLPPIVMFRPVTLFLFTFDSLPNSVSFQLGTPSSSPSTSSVVNHTVVLPMFPIVSLAYTVMLWSW